MASSPVSNKFTSFTSILPCLWTKLHEKTGLNFILELAFMVALFVPIIWRIYVLRTRRSKLPAAPQSWPILGHLHLLGSHPHQSMAKLSDKYGPLMFLKLGVKGALVISSPDMAREVYKKHDFTFSDRPQMIVTDILETHKEGMAFQSSNSSWRNLRKLFTMEVIHSPKKIQESKIILSQEIDDMLRSIFSAIKEHPNNPLEINAKLWLLTSNVISRIILSKRYFRNEGDEESEEAKEFKSVMDEMVCLLGTTFPADCLPFLKFFDFGGLQRRTKVLTPKIQNILTTILEERRDKRKETGSLYVDGDFLDVLLNHQEKEGAGTITEANIRGVIWDTLAGGTDPHVSTCEWAMAHLVCDPTIMRQVQCEIDNVVGANRKVTTDDLPHLKYLQAIVKETFRLHPPLPLLIPSESRTQCNVAGYDVPANTRLLVNVWAIGRDGRTWENPLEFQPERFMKGAHEKVESSGNHYELLPFGSGRRICPGLIIGIVVVQMLLASLIQAFDWSLCDGMIANDLDMTERVGLGTPMATPLQVIPQCRL